MTESQGLQLLPSQKKRFSIAFIRGHHTLFMVIFITLGFLVMSYVVLQLLNARVAKRIEAQNRKIEAIHKIRDKAQEQKLVTADQQLDAVQSLLTTHPTWSRTLSNVQKLIQPRVAFVSFSADTEKRTLQFSAIADNYTTIARQISSFYSSDIIENVTVSSLQAQNTGSIQFLMELTFSKKAIFQFTQ